jgi:hypothetical protein
LEEVVVHAEHKVMMEVDGSGLPLVGNPQGILSSPGLTQSTYYNYCFY